MSTSAKDATLLHKFKDGIQDTVVFLRMLEQFKIPAVMETRRKKLLERLIHLQGDTIREAPPSYEDKVSDATSPKRELGELTRNSSVVDEKVNEYVRIQTKAKEEMSMLSPKKVAPAKEPEAVEEEKPVLYEPSEYMEPTASVERRLKTEETSERPVSTASAASSVGSKKEDTDDANGTTTTGAPGKEKKKRFGTGLNVFRNIKFKSKKSTSNTSEVAVQQNGEQMNGDIAAAEIEDTASIATAEDGDVEGKGEGEIEVSGEVEKEAVVEGIEEEEEEGVAVKSQLEKRVPKRLGKSFNWIKIFGKLKGTTLTMTTGSKGKDLELAGCMVSPSDAATNGIELFSHKEQKQWVFRVETEELRQKWIEELQKAIDESPVESRPSLTESTEEAGTMASTASDDKQQKEDVPEIKIDAVTPSEEEIVSPKRKKFSSTASPARGMKTKPLNEIPDQGIQMKGYLHRKKGTFGGWERVYAVVTYNAIYFTSSEGVREYHHVCMFDGSGIVKIEKKGHDKSSEGLSVKSGKNKETLSLPATAIESWKQVMEDVLGVSQGTLELGSEDEDDGLDAPPTSTNNYVATGTKTAEPIEDQGLYEELPAGEEIEEDIYEEFDDIRPSPSLSPAAPSLPPPRQEQRAPPSPTLPPRNEKNRTSIAIEPTPNLPPRASPTLPPRNSPTPTTKKTATMPAKPPLAQDQGAEELYEDVVAPSPATGGNEEDEELYEDVVNPPPGGTDIVEELYEDVVSSAGPAEATTPTEDYTEMDIGQGPTEDYVTMERVEDQEDIEVYDEVDPNSPQHAPINSISLPSKNTSSKSPTATAGGTKITKPPPPATYVSKQSGNLSHKGPKKSKYYEEWCAVEGTNLCTYKNQKDKRSVDTISLKEFDLMYNPGKDGNFAFHLTKGDKVHYFNPASKEEQTKWITALRELAKCATLELPSGEPEIFETTHDHTAESDEQISFKKGSYIRIITRVSADYWIGQLGNSSQIFTGKIGKFPSSKVALAEDLYI